MGGAEGRVQSGMGQECGGGEGREGRTGGWLGERWRAAPPKLHDTAAALFLRLLGGRRRAQHDANRLIEHILEALRRAAAALAVRSEQGPSRAGEGGEGAVRLDAGDVSGGT